MKALLIFLLLSASMLFCFGQRKGQPELDSLLPLLKSKGEDSTRVQLLNEIANIYPYINPDEGLKFGRSALELSEKISWERGMADSYASMGSNHANKADYANALDNDYKALKIFEKLNDKSRQAVLLQNIGIVMHRSKNQEKSLEYYAKSLALYETLGNRSGQAAIYSNMANAYYTLKQGDKVLENNLKSLHLYEELKDLGGTARLLGNIANFYAEEGDFNHAMVYYFDALRKETALGNKDGVTRNMGNIGETYLDLSKQKIITPDSLIPAGSAANLRKALWYLDKTVSGAKELGQTEYILAFGETLSDAWRLSGNPSLALQIYRDYIAVRDSVYDVEKYNAATRKELDYEYGKREDSIRYEKQIADVKLGEEQKSRRKEKIYFSIGILLVLVFSGFMYNRWKAVEREKKRSDQLLLNILPAETAEELKSTGSAKAKDFDEVTVMFTDFKNFTSMSERLKAQDLVNEINYCYSAFDNIISKYGIEKIKTIGDSYMCAGGLPVAAETAAANTVSAALDIRDFMQREKEMRSAEGKTFFEIRIGLHTGSVVAGIVGIKKFAYDIWGDTVNIAARMESSGEAGKVNVSGATYELLKSDFSFTHRGKIEAKNKGEIDMYFAERSPGEV